MIGLMGKSAGPSYSQVMAGQRQLQQEAFAMQQQAALEQEDRQARRREEERVAELERRRKAELEKAKYMSEQEQREGMVMAEAEGMQQKDNAFGNINLASPQIEQPDYAPRSELE